MGRTPANRGDLFDIDGPEGPRPGVIVTRQTAIPFLANVTVAMVTGTARGVPTEVPVDQKQGLARASVINCHNVFTVPKARLGDYRGSLGPEEMRRLDLSLRIALGLD